MSRRIDDSIEIGLQFFVRRQQHDQLTVIFCRKSIEAFHGNMNIDRTAADIDQFFLIFFLKDILLILSALFLLFLGFFSGGSHCLQILLYRINTFGLYTLYLTDNTNTLKKFLCPLGTIIRHGIRNKDNADFFFS